MNSILKAISFGSLALMIVSALAVFAGKMATEQFFTAALIGTVGWFFSVPFWMKRRLHSDAEEPKG